MATRGIALVTAFLSLVIAWADRGACQCAREIEQLIASDGRPGNRFGWDMDLRGDLLMISARTRGFRSGAVYAFERTEKGWEETGFLRPSDTERGLLFGDSIRIVDDNTVAIGATEADTNPPGPGKVYFFERVLGDWTQGEVVVSDDRAPQDFFGFSLDVSGSTLVVGASEEDKDDPGRGKAYIFEKTESGWVQTQKLYPDQSVRGDGFGDKVQVCGDTAFITSTFGNGGTGAVYVFERQAVNWVQTQQLVGSQARANDNFGVGISFDGITLLAGSPFETSGGGANAGVVYAFRRSQGSWIEEQRIEATDGGRANAILGVLLEVRGDRAIIGADHGGQTPGEAFLFERTEQGWTQVQRLVSSDQEIGDFYGRDVVIDGGTAIVGAMFAGPNEEGAAYVIDLFDPMFTTYGEGWPGTQGIPQWSLDGEPSLGNTITIGFENSLGIDTDGIIVRGRRPIEQLTPFGGTLLVGPQRQLPRIVPAGGFSRQELIPDRCVLAGRTFYLQAALRDPGASHGWSFTPGIVLRIGQ